MVSRAVAKKALATAAVSFACLLVVPTAVRAASVAARPGSIRTVRAVDPTHRPNSPPAVTISATCVRNLGGGMMEAVFGYNNPTDLSVLGSLQSSVVLRTLKDAWRHDETRNLPVEQTQTQLFLPGDHPHVFSVVFPSGQTPIWRTEILARDETFWAWYVTVRPTFMRWCGRTTPKHFAVVNSVVSAAHFNVDDADGVVYADQAKTEIISYDVDMTVTATAICSHGGTPAGAETTYGWNTFDTNMVPLTDVVRVEHGRMWSPTGSRSVADVRTRITFNPPSTDTIGVCSFPDGTQAESLPYWTDSGASVIFTPVCGGAPCDQSALPVSSLSYTAVLPQGTRLR